MNTQEQILTDKQKLGEKSDSTSDAYFLPNFCSVDSVVFVVLGAQLFAFVMILAPNSHYHLAWQDVGLVSLFMQWVALTCCAGLCFLRKHIKRFSMPTTFCLAYTLVLMLTALVSWIAWQVMMDYHLITDVGLSDRQNFVYRNVAISSIIALIWLRYFYIQQQWKQQILIKSRAQVEALQSRIRPHFLFNSLNTIANLIRTEPQLAEVAVEDLAELFRSSINASGSLATIKQELELCEHYIRIEQLRLGARLQVNWDMEQVPGDAKIPLLTLQPLVENAIYHGIQTLEQGGTITVKGRFESNNIAIEIRNPITDKAGSYQKKTSNQVAQLNTRKRLETLFGRKGSLLTQTLDNEYIVDVCFPYQI